MPSNHVASDLEPCSRNLPSAYDRAVSHDLYFLNRHDGQSWDEVLKAMEDAAEDSEPISARLLGAWDRIVPQARTLLGEVHITAAVILGKVFALSAIVEKETGLTAYDPQAERPLAQASTQGAIALMSRTTEDLHRRYGD